MAGERREGWHGEDVCHTGAVVPRIVAACRSDFPSRFLNSKSMRADLNSLFLPHCVIPQLNHSGNKRLDRRGQSKARFVSPHCSALPLAPLGPPEPNSYLGRTCVWRMWLSWTLDCSEGMFVYLKDVISSQVWTQEGTRAGRTRLRQTAWSQKGCFCFCPLCRVTIVMYFTINMFGQHVSLSMTKRFTSGLLEALRLASGRARKRIPRSLWLFFSPLLTKQQQLSFFSTMSCMLYSENEQKADIWPEWKENAYLQSRLKSHSDYVINPHPSSRNAWISSERPWTNRTRLPEQFSHSRSGSEKVSDCSPCK